MSDGQTSSVLSYPNVKSQLTANPCIAITFHGSTPIQSPFDNPYSGFTLTRSAANAALLNDTNLLNDEGKVPNTNTDINCKAQVLVDRPRLPQRRLPSIPSLSLSPVSPTSSSEVTVSSLETNQLLNSLLSSPPPPPPTPMTPATTSVPIASLPPTPSTPHFAPRVTPAYLDNTPVYQSSISDLGVLTTGVVGLRNLGNTCFMNSVIQCISSTLPLARFFLNGNFKRHINYENPHGSHGALSDQFARLIRAIWEGQYNVISPVSFKEAICRQVTHFGGNDQQDAQEFLIFLLDGLHEDLNHWDKRPRPELDISDEAFEQLSDMHAEAITWERYQMRHSSIIVSLMQGQLRSRLVCKHCNMTSTNYSPFTFLSIPIPKKKGKSSITACLDDLPLRSHLKATMHGEHCPKCKKARSATKKLNLARLPNVLIIHLKRFSFQGPFRDKLDTMVDFPLSQLDVAKYVTPGLKSTVSPSTYNLYGVVNHYGGLNGGHYTACVKRAYDQRWYNYDDSRVSACDESTLLSKAAYILFYVRSSVA
ncbi:hypothetical protein BDF19DRAFT_455205 [Syncephalis fuscata]|nr:hypothetical protein BDF19DRAFT_455205 [Syncephalis fuscata]